MASRHGAAVAGVFLRPQLRGHAAAQSGFAKLAELMHSQHDHLEAFRSSAAVESARQHEGPVLINFKVEQEDTVYPMGPAGAALHDIDPRPSPIVETAEDE